MRIDRLELRNFKKFTAFDLDLHRQFTLLIGENGAGKTSVLDALAVALGVWLAYMFGVARRNPLRHKGRIFN